jgi:integrase/recombinase XerD
MGTQELAAAADYGGGSNNNNKNKKNKDKDKVIIGKPIDSFSNNVSVDRKVKEACTINGQLPPSFQRLFLELPTDHAKELVADFIIHSYHERNITLNTKRVYVATLVYLSRAFNHKKAFEEMDIVKDVVSGYLNTCKRPFEADPDQRWIATYRVRAAIIRKFFKWLKPDEIPASTLRTLKPIAKKGSKSRVKTTDLWTREEDALFLKYCEDPLIACYHAMSRDCGARPSEMLAIRIGDVKVKKDSNSGKVFAEVQGVGRYGKTREARTVPMISSVPYFKAWIAQHPMGANPEAYLFISREHSARYRNVPLKEESLYAKYRTLKVEHFAKKVLQRPDVPPEQKAILRKLLENKPWHPYNRRHVAIDEKKALLNDYQLRQYAGWSKNSSMVDVYTHDLGDESSSSLLLAYGIDAKLKSKEDQKQQREEEALIQNIACPHCSEPNKPDARFCLNCKMVLTLDEYNQTKQEAETTKKRLEELEAKQKAMELDAITRQQQQIESMKVAFEKTQDQVKTLHELFAKVQEEEAKTSGPLQNFLIGKLNALGDQGIDVNQYPPTEDEQERKKMKEEMEESKLAEKIYQEYLLPEHGRLIQEMKRFGEIRSRRSKNNNNNSNNLPKK